MNLKQWYRQAVRNGVVYVECEHTSRSNMLGCYNFYTVKGNALEVAWPFTDESQGFDPKLASKLGFHIRKNRRSFERGGCGYDRALDAFLDIARECGSGDAVEVQQKVRLINLSMS